MGGSTAFLRATTGDPPVKLGPGYALALAPDGRSVLLRTEVTGGKVLLQPVGSGASRILEASRPDARISAAFFAPDGRVCWTERTEKGEVRNWIRALDQPPRPLGPEGFRVISVAPDLRRLVLLKRGTTVLWKDGKDPPRALPAVTQDHRIAGWKGSGSLLVQPIEPGRSRVECLDLASGRLSPYVDLTPVDRSGLAGSSVLSCRDGRAWAITCYWYNVDLYLAVPNP